MGYFIRPIVKVRNFSSTWSKLWLRYSRVFLFDYLIFLIFLMLLFLYLYFIYWFVFMWDWGSNPVPHVCWASALPLSYNCSLLLEFSFPRLLFDSSSWSLSLCWISHHIMNCFSQFLWTVSILLCFRLFEESLFWFFVRDYITILVWDSVANELLYSFGSITLYFFFILLTSLSW